MGPESLWPPDWRAQNWALAFGLIKKGDDLDETLHLNRWLGWARDCDLNPKAVDYALQKKWKEAVCI
jgi:hypothetical protein